MAEITDLLAQLMKGILKTLIGKVQEGLPRRTTREEISEKDINSSPAVFVLAKGSFPHITVNETYLLSTPSTIFPKSLTGDATFMPTTPERPWKMRRRM